jgi:hypothetical protein
MPEMPRSPALDAQTDQVIAFLRDAGGMLEGPEGAFYKMLAGAQAAVLREQFPAVADLGRIVVSVAQNIAATSEALRLRGFAQLAEDPFVLMSITALAGQQLDRESA